MKLSTIFAAGTLASVLMMGTALAADPILPAPVYDPIAEVASDWTGFYIGASLGGVWADANATGEPFVSPETIDETAEGFAAGIYAGYNWQLSDMFVLGVEGEVSWNDIAFSADRPSGEWNYLTSDWSASVAARAGILVTPDVLLYGKLGYAWFNTDMAEGAPEGWGTNFLTGIEDGTIGAVVAGAGIEVAVTETISLRAEALHHFAGDEVSVSYGDIVYSYEPSFTTVKAGISFNF